MASPKKDLLDFEKAIEYMDPMQVTEYLHKTLDFLKRNDTELFFPNISSYTEAFLVRLVTKTKNLKSNSLNFENKTVATEIIHLLEMNKDVFRWTYGYESGKHNRDLLVYKKLYSNKIKMKPSQFKKPMSTLAQRLVKAQAADPAPTGKTHLLNMTLRFLKTDSEHTLVYPEMPLAQAQFIYSLIMHPTPDSSVGFGYKSLYAPLIEALHVCGANHVLELTFVETSSCETTALKLEKKPRQPTNDSSREESSPALKVQKKARKPTNDSSREESSLNSSLSSTTSKKKRKKKSLINGVTTDFVAKTLKRLLRFTGSSGMASVTFERLSDEELVFIKGVKTLAASTASYGDFEPEFRDSLEQLNSNIVEVMKTCKLRIEEGVTKKTQARYLTVKKVPRETVPATPVRAHPPSPVTRSKSAVTVKSRDRSLSKERRVQFESAGKLDPAPAADTSAADEPEPSAAAAAGRGRSPDRLNARKTKLLEDMSVPIESDIGMRMMLLMGWRGGALGARGDGILEPIVPHIELPPGAGLGHVPPPKPETRVSADFRLALLQNILELLQHQLDSKEVEFKTPMNKKERKYLTSALNSLNQRTALALGVKAEMDTCKKIMQVLTADIVTVLTAEVSKDLKKITLTQSKNSSRKSLSKIITKLNKQAIKDAPVTMTVLNTNQEYDLINDDCITAAIQDVLPKINTTCKTPVAIRYRATRMLILQRFIQVLKEDKSEKVFRFAGALKKRLVAFLEDVVGCVNGRVRSSYVAPEESGLFDELARRARGWQLAITFESASRFVFSKTPCHREYQNRFYNSAWPKPHDNNNDAQTDNQNQPEASAHNDDTDVIVNDNVSEENNNHDITSVVVNGDERTVNLRSVENGNTKTETECDIENKDNYFNITNVDKEVKATIKKETAGTADETSNDSLCVCDTNVDISDLDRDIQELELAIFEVDLNMDIKKDCDADNSPRSKRSRSNSFNPQEPNTKRSKLGCNKNFLIISPNDPERTIDTEIVGKLQSRISQEIDKCTYFLPFLQCHGVQNVGLVYSCHDTRDVDWLKTVIRSADLNLNVVNSPDVVCIDQKSRKMAIKINSFIPLASKKAFQRLELYNNGLQTSLWKVLAEKTFSSYVLFIVEVDENSFKYIAKENLSLYVGIDKAQFSVIF